MKSWFQKRSAPSKNNNNWRQDGRRPATDTEATRPDNSSSSRQRGGSLSPPPPRPEGQSANDNDEQQACQPRQQLELMEGTIQDAVINGNEAIPLHHQTTYPGDPDNAATTVAARRDYNNNHSNDSRITGDHVERESSFGADEMLKILAKRQREEDLDIDYGDHGVNENIRSNYGEVSHTKSEGKLKKPPPSSQKKLKGKLKKPPPAPPRQRQQERQQRRQEQQQHKQQQTEQPKEHTRRLETEITYQHNLQERIAGQATPRQLDSNNNYLNTRGEMISSITSLDETLKALAKRERDESIVSQVRQILERDGDYHLEKDSILRLHEDLHKNIRAKSLEDNDNATTSARGFARLPSPGSTGTSSHGSATSTPNSMRGTRARYLKRRAPSDPSLRPGAYHKAPGEASVPLDPVRFSRVFRNSDNGDDDSKSGVEELQELEDEIRKASTVSIGSGGFNDESDGDFFFDLEDEIRLKSSIHNPQRNYSIGSRQRFTDDEEEQKAEEGDPWETSDTSRNHIALGPAAAANRRKEREQTLQGRAVPYEISSSSLKAESEKSMRQQILRNSSIADSPSNQMIVPFDTVPTVASSRSDYLEAFERRPSRDMDDMPVQDSGPIANLPNEDETLHGNMEVLVEATLVRSGHPEDSVSVYLEAHHVTHAELLHDFIKTPKGMAILVLSILFLAGLIVGLVVGVKATNKDSAAFVPTEAPSFAPTQAPTVEFTMTMLPDFSIDAIMENPNSPQALAWDWIQDDPHLQEIPTERKLKRFALATLFFATNGEQWANSENWLSYEHHECDWYTSDIETGLQRPVSCGVLESVSSVNLDQNLLVGTIPPVLGLLQGLRYINFSGNTLLEGTIPSTLGLLSNSLESINLSGNSLYGSIPREIGNLSRLTYLDLSSNNELRGSLPTQLGGLLQLKKCILNNNSLIGSLITEIGLMSNLNTFDVGANRLIGSLPCDELGKLTNLKTLILQENKLHGEMCSEIGNLYNLAFASLSSNPLSDKIPTELGLLTMMTSLQIGETQLTGHLPNSLFLLTKLNDIGLHDMLLTGPISSDIGRLTSLRTLTLTNSQFSSSLPTELGLLIKATSLDFSDNWLTGTVPTELGQLQAIKHLRLDQNMLSGWIPSEIFSRNTRLRDFSLSENMFTGSIPSEVGLAKGLETLTVSKLPDVRGPIPSEIGLLTNLLELDLRICDFSGSIPNTIWKLSQLEYLDLSENSIEGTIDTEIGLLKNLLSLDFGFNKLTGQVPSEISVMFLLEFWRISQNSLTGTLPTSVDRLSQLTSLQLDSNAFTGRLPDGLSNLSMLKRFDIESTNFTHDNFFTAVPTSLEEYWISFRNERWSLPTEIGRYTNLKQLQCHYSSLDGSIPSEIGLLTAMTSLNMWNNALTGSIPSEIGLMTRLEGADFESNNLQGFPQELFELSSLVSLWLSGNPELTGSVPCDDLSAAVHVDCANVSCSCCRCS